MNNRAALVDTWRLIEFNANALQSDVSIRFDGDLQTIGNDNPAKFRDQTGSMRASLQIDPPFTRLLERNNFRQQLIQYQQDRRQLIQFEDQLRENVRQIIRDVNQLKVNLEIQRRAVSIAIRRVDQTREALGQPVPPAQPGQLPQSFGPTAAQNLLFALSDLRNTQNNLMSVWLNYLEARMLLYRELGVMQIDQDNLWIDTPLSLVTQDLDVEIEQIPAVPREWVRELKKLPSIPPAPSEVAPQLKPVPNGLRPVPSTGAAFQRRSNTGAAQLAVNDSGDPRLETGWIRLRRWFGEKTAQARPSRSRESAKRESNLVSRAITFPRPIAGSRLIDAPKDSRILGSRLPDATNEIRPVTYDANPPTPRRTSTMKPSPRPVSDEQIEQLVDEVRHSENQRSSK
ncbi:MAG: TolC family protein [Planctomycetota bacterium]|nr:TolC family protein [Planctomycetota bacterium]